MLPVSASKVPSTTNVTEKYDRLGDSSNCSVCGKELLGNVGEQNALSVALGLTVCNDCWWQILYGNDYDTVINNVAKLGEDGKVLPSQLPSMQGGETAWGYITGAISNQTDLQTILNQKLSANQNITLSGILSGSGTTSITASAGTGYYMPSTTDQTNWNSKLSNETDPIVKAISGIVKSDGTIISAATAGTDYATLGYTLEGQAASQATTTDGQTLYWGSMIVAPSTTANRWRIYIPKTGVIESVYIYSYSGTAGSAENWSTYIRLNNTSDTLIQTLAVNTNDRVWSNTSLNISVTQGNYIEIKEVCPTWATNPATVTRVVTIYIKG